MKFKSARSLLQARQTGGGGGGQVPYRAAAAADNIKMCAREIDHKWIIYFIIRATPPTEGGREERREKGPYDSTNNESEWRLHTAKNRINSYGVSRARKARNKYSR